MAKQLELVKLSDYHVELPRVVEKIEIYRDDCCESPRKWDNLGEMVIRKALGDHLSGDRFIDDEDMNDLIARCKEESLVFVPVYALIHSGIWLSTTKSFNGYTCQWDTSFCGVIYAEDEAIAKEYGDLSPASRGKAIACFESELKTYEQFLQGDVYSFSTFDKDGFVIDCCGGFYGSDPFANGMSEHISSEYHELLKVAAESIKYG